MAVAGYRYRKDGGSPVDVGNVLTATVSGLTAETEYDFEVQAYDAAGNFSAWSSVVPVSTWPQPRNYALASLGATATSSSNNSASFLPSSVIRGERTTEGSWAGPGHTWLAGGDPASSPEWVAVQFGASRTISEIDVIGISDLLDYTIEPTRQSTNATYGLLDYKVQYWNGSSFVDIATVTGNTFTWRKFIFSPITTTEIRVRITDGQNALAFVVAVEAWGSPGNPHAIVAEGDSRTAVAGSPSAVEWPQVLQRSLDNTYAIENVATGGETIANMLASYGSQIAPLYNDQALNVLIIGGAGINDFGASRTLAAIKADYLALVAAAQADGFKVIAGTVPKAVSTFVGGGNETNRVAFNAWIMAGSSLADAVTDLASDPAFSDTTDTTYYYTDEIHYTQASCNVIAGLFQTTLATLTP